MPGDQRTPALPLRGPDRIRGNSAPRTKEALTDEVRQYAITAARAAAAKTGSDTLVLEVGDIIAITDYFVITAATNTRAVKAIADEVERQLREQGQRPTQTEGLRDATWVLMDYGGFIVHVFLDETRSYYRLERLWADAATVAWEETAAAVS